MATMKILVVGGGGGGGTGGTGVSGGGSGGQVQYNTALTVVAGTYAVTVDGGGAIDINGGSSSFSTITSIGGGHAGSGGIGPGTGAYGGGAWANNSNYGTGANGTIAYKGGDSYPAPQLGAGGGGGAGGNGVNALNTFKAGDGGIGVSNSISGSAVTYGGGGGGAVNNATSSNRGLGKDGGGDGGYSDGVGTGTNGLANRGGGAGGNLGSGAGGLGGSGVVIMRYTTASYGTVSVSGTGNTLVVDGTETVATFIVSGNFKVYGVTTQAVTVIKSDIATGNGTITSPAGTCTKRGVVWSTSTHTDPGNVAPASSAYSGKTEETGSFTAGAFTEVMTSLLRNTTYYVRAYVYNSLSEYNYGDEVSYTTIQFTNPANIYASDNTYATLAATSGILTVEVSKDAGANWQTPKTVTFTASDTLQTVGLGATELFGSSFTRADMVDANFRVRLSQGNISQVYKTFGFATGSDILTGIEIAIEGKYAFSTLSLDLLEVKIYYGTSVLPVQVGSQAFASNGRKAGEGAGSGTGVLVFYDGNNWIASDSGGTVAA